MNVSNFGLYRLGIAYFMIQLQFWFPIWIVFLIERGLTFYDVIIADIVYWIAVVLLEFPMGYIGDRIGRRTTYFLGALFGAGTYLVMSFISNFSSLVITWICWSIFLATISGTDTAYIYELIKDNGLIDKSNTIFGYFAALTSLAFIASHFFAGFLYSFNSSLPILVNSACAVAAGCLIITLPNPKVNNDLYSIPNIKEVVMDIAWKNNSVRILIFVLALLYAYSWATTLIFQPFLLELGLNIEVFGIIYLAFTSLGVLGGLITGKLVNLIGSYIIIMIGTLGMWLAIGIAGFISGLFSLVGIIMIRFFYFLSESPLKVLINNEIENKYRASIFSLSNLLASILLILFRPLIGYLSEEYSSGTAFQIWFSIGIMICISILFLIYKLRNQILLA
ncbi:MAG: MFS transporter [Candidatus Lokiarchaeota archaeon]|nr:MFS transporter [Candidatus Lokiarchaeota archaeon]MBD3199374.1 MFS transporter [Candidatus Lokiarchaeota archaeon]